MSFLLPIQLFKILADETRLGIVYCSANWESYASAISALLSTSRSPRSPATWHCCVNAGYCWIASKVSGFITAYRRIFQHGRRKLLMRPGDVNRKRFRQLSANWLDKIVPQTVRTFAVKKFI
ncbi:arsenical resistance operon repressor [Escherichia coli]|uniref:Arsenical resistance operon repressor n=1 Tax=Escherichia coli TaxID=562 RepID=A0A485J7H2_ECOLX|nr:arsenical resistance operon repressor [Escherichia coli]